MLNNLNMSMYEYEYNYLFYLGGGSTSVKKSQWAGARPPSPTQFLGYISVRTVYCERI